MPVRCGFASGVSEGGGGEKHQTEKTTLIPAGGHGARREAASDGLPSISGEKCVSSNYIAESLGDIPRAKCKGQITRKTSLARESLKVAFQAVMVHRLQVLQQITI